MANCSDPYRELELYLEEAQEEIGKAFEELLQHEATSAYKSWNDVDTVVAPPAAFRSSSGHTLCCRNVPKTNHRTSCVSNTNLNRVCYDGTVLDLQKPPYGRRRESDSSYLLQKSLSCSAAFPGDNNKQITNNGQHAFNIREIGALYAHDKPKPKPFRSAISFPEGSIDAFLRERVLNRAPQHCPCEKNGDAMPLKKTKNNVQTKTKLCRSAHPSLMVDNFVVRHPRQRSYSETSPPNPDSSATDEHFHTFPRPPSGDVNLLSIWADNLVLEIDKTMPIDLDDSIGSYSPMSDYSLSPIKNEDDNQSTILVSQTMGNRKRQEGSTHQASPILPQICSFKPNSSSNYFKSMSPSPDSGIGPILYEPTELEDCVFVDPANIRYANHNGMSEKEKFSRKHNVDITDSITPPPPGFEDKKPEIESNKSFLCGREPSSRDVNHIPIYKKDAETQVRQQVLKVATCVIVQTDSVSEEENTTKEIHRRARVIPSMTVDLEECATLTTTCAISDPPWKGAVFNGVEHPLKHQRLPPQSESSIYSDRYFSASDTTADDVFEDAELRQPENIQDSLAITNNGTTLHFSTLPKQMHCAKDVDRYSCSLPRDAGRIIPEDKCDSETPQRSASSSAVSSVSHVSMEELAVFMRKVKTSTYHPPPRADVSVDAKDTDSGDSQPEDSNRDAITQTTPVLPLSRSSSFTWVTECDCSDWDSSNPRSESEDSLLVMSGTNTTTSEKKAPQSSSSASTDDDGFDPPQDSGSSSLYLSACSEASDSSTSDSFSQEQKTYDVTTASTAGPPPPDTGSLLTADDSSLVGNFKSLSTGGVLMDIAEEDTVTSRTISGGSLNGGSSEDLSIKGPSSLPLAVKSGNNSYRGQPIEATVLVVNELTGKSVPAPILRPKKHPSVRKGQLLTDNLSLPPTGTKLKNGSSNHEPKSEAVNPEEDAELQAIEACRWLRATGFPQYGQMYEDNLFPIDICTVQKDHAFLHPDSIQSLFRRLNTLNRCARMKFVDHVHHKSLQQDDSDDEELCALSENWQFQRISRRWSRVPSPTEVESDCNKAESDHPVSPKLNRHPISGRKFLTPEEAYCSSHDSVFVEDQHSSPDSIRRSAPRRDGQYIPIHNLQNSPGSSSGSGGTLSLASEEAHDKTFDPHQKKLHRSGSDRIKEGAKALLRRMESLKGKRKKKNGETANGAVGKQDLSLPSSTNNGTDCSSCSSSLTSSPMINRSCRLRVPGSYDSPDCCQGGTPQVKHRKKGWSSVYKNDHETGAHSDSECPIFVVSETWQDANCNNTKMVENYVSPQATLKVPELSASGYSPDYSVRSNVQQENKTRKKKNVYTSGNSPKDGEKQFNRASHYDNVPAPLAVFNNACVDNIGRGLRELGKPWHLADRNGDHVMNENNDGEIIIINSERRDSGVGASLTRGSSQHYAPWHSFRQQPMVFTKSCQRIIPITDLSAPQVLLLRKLSLLKLTTLMEKFSPSSRTGWSWAVPKFIRRIRTPDYKDKTVFGVPLLLVLQRTGQPLPFSIQAAIDHLKNTALGSTGLFRKSGVRSRIQKLRNLNETSPETIIYEDHQAYDVADMLKQYFRELPEALLTNKLSETFISIFQYIPHDMRLDAIQAAFLLMPDENREVLQALLGFLLEVCEHSDENQMSATNLSVCFAPSLFHLSAPRSASASPRRRKTVGAPDLRELNENRAAYECLTSMVSNFKQICSVTEETFLQNRLPPGIDDYEPAALDELSSLVHKDYRGWKIYIEGCIQAMLKESKDKYKGWVNVCQTDNVDLSFKKVGDGHPLRLWKVSTEVEAPPTELLNRILRERHLWDTSFIKWRVIQTLDKRAEIFQYVCSSILPHPSCNYYVIRSWKTDLPKGACILIEASIDHSNSPTLVEGVNAIILASRYLIEPCGSGKCRITHISRVDTKGRSPEWYHRAYGYIATLNLMKLRDSFSHVRTEGPETKV